jgi:hypothetical protein
VAAASSFMICDCVILVAAMYFSLVSLVGFFHPTVRLH